LFSITVSEKPNKKIENTKVKALSKEFQSIFDEPKQYLPSVRRLDHKIPLVPGV
jgi:hypothetical protein